VSEIRDAFPVCVSRHSGFVFRYLTRTVPSTPHHPHRAVPLIDTSLLVFAFKTTAVSLVASWNADMVT
jgi:hypothetical protein